MSDVARREHSFLMGISILVVVVTMAFFGLTMAIKQMGQRRARWHEVRQQLARAQQQTQQPPAPAQRDQLAVEARHLAQQFVTMESGDAARQQLESLASSNGVAIQFLPVLAPEPPSQPLAGFEGCYHVMPLVATVEGRYRALATFLNRAAAVTDPLLRVRTCTISPVTGGEGGHRLSARLVVEGFVWIPGALPKSPVKTLDESPAEPMTESRPTWGRDPFDARYLATPGVEGIALNGVIWDPQHPTCILNGMVLGVGGVVKGYTVTAITQDAVVLRGERELVLTVSS